ncbi:MAG: NADPH:quinone reductase [Planctomycetes bacterium]|nr:NADPH:quinone reductase [Planctomycetota bacterium]MBM4057325.1 NADPH:quinone reductase [Planctomycetota bacterium]
MKAAFIRRTGGPEVITCRDLPDPVPGPRQALVRVRAAAVNPIDTYIRSGVVSMPLPVPYVVGCDLAGEVVAVGNEVDRLRPGMRVWGSNQGLLGRQGTCAELAAVDEQWLYPTPDGVTDRDAAAAALVSITAHLGLVSHAALQPGETIFVSGGSGGVGSAVVQIARALGGRVIATAGTIAKRERVESYGGDVVLDYRRPDLVAAVLAAAPAGVQVHWETRPDPDFDTAIATLAEGGRMVLMAGRQSRPPLPVGPFYVKGCRLLGFVMFKAPAQQQAAAAADINRWLASGRLRVPVDRVVTLAHVAEAHALQEAATVRGSGELAGKIVVEP